MTKIFCMLCVSVFICTLFLPVLHAQRKSLASQNTLSGTVSIKEWRSEKLSPEKQKRMDSFEKVWNVVKDNYFDQTFGGLNWNQVKTDYTARILQARSDGEFHTVLQEMINLLNKSHFLIVPPEINAEIGRVRAQIAPRAGNNEKTVLSKDAQVFGIGIDLRYLNEQIVITQIKENSAAERAGLKTGYVIEKINDFPIDEWINVFLKNKAYAKIFEKQLPALLLSLIERQPVRNSITLVYKDEKEQTNEIKINREPLKGKLVKILPDFPAEFITFESRLADQQIGYIKFNAFALTSVEKFCTALSDFREKKALIIDLRGNSGGNLGAMYGITSLLIGNSLLLGTEISKTGKEARVVKPQPKNFKGKLVILVDRQSLSSAEIFAAGLKENNRAFVIGENSGGAALPALSIRLPTGALFLYPIANFQTPKGNLIEGVGVEPDLKIALDRKSLLEGRDLQLEAAINFLKNEKEKNSTTGSQINFTKAASDQFIFGSAVIKNEPPRDHAVVAHDEKALKIIDEYIAATGGRENWQKLNSWRATGTAELNQAGTIVTGEAEIFRQAPNKVAKVTKIETLGEIREIFDGQKSFVQTNFMGTQKNEMFINEIRLASAFAELLNARAIYSTLAFEVEFEQNGRKISLVKAVTSEGSKVYFAFDSASKLLISRAGFGVSTAFDDYRKVGDWLFPFKFTEGTVTYKLKIIEPNARIERESFEQKESCFSKPD